MTAQAELRAELLQRVAAIAPVIVAGSATAEASGELSPAVLTALRDSGLVNLYLPRSLGGLEVDPVTCAQVVEAVGELDSAAAWMLMVANVPRFTAAAWPQDLVEEVWGNDPLAIAAISGNQPFTAVPCDGGYRVSGHTGFASGCRHARWFVAPTKIVDAVGALTGRGLLVLPMDACEIIDNWNVLGMRGTGSHDVRLTDKWFEARRLVTFTGAAAAGAGPASASAARQSATSAANPYFTGPLYRCARRVVFATYVPISLAVAARAIAALDDLAANKVPYASDRTLAHRPHAQAKYGYALASLRAGRGYFHTALQTAWERAVRGELPSDRQRADLYLAAIHAVQAAAHTVRSVCDAAGSSAIYRDGPLERLLRDMEVLRQHGFTSENRYANVAQVYWDVPLEYAPLLQ